MLRPRTRLISLRITEEEYELIRRASADGGARCVSEFVRNALLTSAQPVTAPNCTDDVHIRLTRVEKDVAQLAGELHAHICSKSSPDAGDGETNNI